MAARRAASKHTASQLDYDQIAKKWVFTGFFEWACTVVVVTTALLYLGVSQDLGSVAATENYDPLNNLVSGIVFSAICIFMPILFTLSFPELLPICNPATLVFTVFAGFFSTHAQLDDNELRWNSWITRIVRLLGHAAFMALGMLVAGLLVDQIADVWGLDKTVFRINGLANYGSPGIVLVYMILMAFGFIAFFQVFHEYAFDSNWDEDPKEHSKNINVHVHRGRRHRTRAFVMYGLITMFVMSFLNHHGLSAIANPAVSITAIIIGEGPQTGPFLAVGSGILAAVIAAVACWVIDLYYAGSKEGDMQTQLKKRVGQKLYRAK